MGSVVDAVISEVEALGERAVGSTLAETALSLARDLDLTEFPCEHCGEMTEQNRTSATARAMCAKAMVEVLRELRALMPAKPEDDEVERARKRRADRLAWQSEAGASSSS